jgi:hypothetical protein
LFTDYDGNLLLSDSRKSKLKNSRTCLRNKIRNYFKENKPEEIQPKFTSQGSFVMETIINPTPIEKDGKTITKYDLDDGVYFLGGEEPKDRITIETYHNWIVEAIDGHTDTPPVDKNTSVRTIFDDGHHIDMPIYYKKNSCIPELAHKANGWVESDPAAFAEWFNEKADVTPQLRRLTRYMKGWRDARHIKNSATRMPSGLILTILTANNFKANNRDDIAMKDTLIAIHEELKKNFVCLRPTAPINEDLLKEYSKARKDYFMEQLEGVITSAKQAIEEPNQKDSCLKWQKHLGERFPCQNAKDEIEDAKEYLAPAVIRRNAGSA